MGLDVYLYKVDDLAKKLRLEEEGEKRTSAVWDEYGEYNNLTDEQKDEASQRNKSIYQELGLTGEYGSYPEENIEIDSPTHPEHIFKIGYFRSSYNGAGINSFFRRLGLPTLYDLFMVDEGEYIDATQWDAARPRVVDCIAAYQKIIAGGVLDCFFVSGHNKPDQPQSEKDALDLFNATMDKDTGKPFRNWENSMGLFYSDGLECVGFLHGDSYGSRGTYIIYKKTKDSLDFYLHSLEIVLETIDYVLAQIDRDKFTYYLRWSG